MSLKESIAQLFKVKPQIVELNFGPVSINVPRKVLEQVPFNDPQHNLKIAREHGILPVSLKEIMDQARSNGLNFYPRRAVLFDTPPVAYLAGNHWRINDINQQDSLVELSLCNPFGNYTYRQFPPVRFPLDAQMFTGLSVQEYKFGSRLLSLQSVEDLLRSEEVPYERIKHTDEKTFWSNQNGKLTKLPRGESAPRLTR